MKRVIGYIRIDDDTRCRVNQIRARLLDVCLELKLGDVSFITEETDGYEYSWRDYKEICNLVSVLNPGDSVIVSSLLDFGFSIGVIIDILVAFKIRSINVISVESNRISGGYWRLDSISLDGLYMLSCTIKGIKDKRLKKLHDGDSQFELMNEAEKHPLDEYRDEAIGLLRAGLNMKEVAMKLGLGYRIFYYYVKSRRLEDYLI